MKSIHATDDSFAQSTRITPQEAGLLQTFPPDFKWVGTKGEVGLMIGNAVPVLLAKAILEELWSE